MVFTYHMNILIPMELINIFMQYPCNKFIQFIQYVNILTYRCGVTIYSYNRFVWYIHIIHTICYMDDHVHMVIHTCNSLYILITSYNICNSLYILITSYNICIYSCAHGHPCNISGHHIFM